MGFQGCLRFLRLPLLTNSRLSEYSQVSCKAVAFGIGGFLGLGKWSLGVQGFKS